MPKKEKYIHRTSGGVKMSIVIDDQKLGFFLYKQGGLTENFIPF
jgi:hypothetical protein